MICGSCGMRMDGAAVLACKTRMVDIAESGPRPGDLGDGEHADRQGPRRGHGALLGEDPRRPAVAPARLLGSGREGARRLAGADGRDPQGVALHHVRLLRLRVQLDGGRPGLPRPGRARQGDALRGRCRATGRRSSACSRTRSEHGIWDCTRCYFCNERCPKGVDPRDAIAKLGAEAMKDGHRLRHGRQAREVVRHLGEDDRLAARDRARPEDAGHREVAEGGQVRDGALQARQGAAAGAAARREARGGVARALRPREGTGSRGRRRDRAVGEGAVEARVRAGER